MTSFTRLFQLRPKPAQWFDTYVPRQKTVYALEALAQTGQVELENDPRFASPLVVDEVRDIIRRFGQLERHYSDDFPLVDSPYPEIIDAPEQDGRHALNILRSFCARAAFLRRRQRRYLNEINNMILLRECIDVLDCDSQVFDGFMHDTELLYKRIFACPRTQAWTPAEGESIDLEVNGEYHDFYFIAALPQKQDEIEKSFTSCHEVHVPDWMTGDCKQKRERIRSHLVPLEHELVETRAALADLREDADAADALAKLSVLKWFLENVPELASKQKLCHVTGWTTADKPEELENALKESNIDIKIRYSEMPIGVRPPVMRLRSGWAAPFQVFVELLGTPDKSEVDPSILLPVIVPLLFGFMFPDVGHGLVLLVIGLFASHSSRLKILVPCGLTSIAFGFLFGGFFGRNDIIEALWFQPQLEPIRILIICMVFGFFLILLSIIFSGIEAYWKGNLRRWALLEVAVLVMYISGIIGVFLYPDILLITPVALIFYLAGIVYVYHGNTIRNLLRGLAGLLESLFELILNTISFMRVGVFALAHHGISSAINQIAEQIDNMLLFVLTLVAGHILVIVIETLVVFIQTTRLVVFEFFIRFLQAEGRIFQPLDLPVRQSET